MDRNGSGYNSRLPLLSESGEGGWVMMLTVCYRVSFVMVADCAGGGAE